MNAPVRRPPAFVPTLTDIVAGQAAAAPKGLDPDAPLETGIRAPVLARGPSPEALDRVADALTERVMAVVRLRVHETVLQELQTWSLFHAADWSDRVAEALRDEVARECRGAAAAVCGIEHRADPPAHRPPE